LKDHRPGSADWEAVNGARFYPTFDFKPTVKPCRDSEMSSDQDATREELADGEQSGT